MYARGSEIFGRIQDGASTTCTRTSSHSVYSQLSSVLTLARAELSAAGGAATATGAAAESTATAPAAVVVGVEVASVVEEKEEEEEEETTGTAAAAAAVLLVASAADVSAEEEAEEEEAAGTAATDGVAAAAGAGAELVAGLGAAVAALPAGTVPAPRSAPELAALDSAGDESLDAVDLDFRALLRAAKRPPALSLLALDATVPVTVGPVCVAEDAADAAAAADAAPLAEGRG